MPRGTPQIEITYDVDANGILQVSAVEKSSGKVEKITITNESSRLSKEEIERMVKEAEKFKADDDKVKARIDAKNKLESYCYNFKSTVLGEEKMKTALGDDLKTVETTLEEAIKWLDDNSNATTEEFENKYKETEKTLSPLLAKAYQATTGSGANMPAGAEMPSGFEMPTGSGPKTSNEDVD